jgi:lipid-A-disaccharide synthase
MTAPKPRLGDHLKVLWLLLATVAGVVPFALHVLVAPIATPIARRRMRRRLQEPPPRPEEPPAVDAAAWRGKTLFVVAGEPSGDRLAARVVSAVRARAPGLIVRGYGGPALVGAGAALDRNLVDHAVVGFWAVVRSLSFWWRVCAQFLAYLREEPPDVLLTVDFPGLNLRLARWARRRGVRVLHLVAPQTWAWAPWRSRRLAKAADALLVTFPFEPAVFRDAGVRATYVGHPLFETPLLPPRTPENLHWAPRIELRPGSRRRDVRRQGPIVVAAAARVAERLPDARFVVRLAGPKAAAEWDRIADEGIRHVCERSGETSDRSVAAAITTSGTSTAELAAALVPMVVFYRVSLLGRLGKSLLVTSPFVAMANLLAGKEVVPERLVSARGGAALGDELVAILETPGRWKAMRDALVPVRERLAHENVADRIARAVLAR